MLTPTRSVMISESGAEVAMRIDPTGLYWTKCFERNKLGKELG